MNMPRVPITLQQAVMRCLRDKLQQANQRLDAQYPEPKITYRQRGTSAGTAWLKEWEIRINPVLLAENGQPFIEEVVPHELAHLLVYRHFGNVAPHGREWQWMMGEILELAPRRTHRFAVASVAGKTFPYTCRCQTHQLTLRRHNRVVRGESEYRCRHCGDILQRQKG
ncbi:SprT family zinc-dependent metalloprotease [Enterobacillus tribolii]|nr:SprT family zinc-dependent metalloprotease [Enterobacillus tribolii]MBW7982958.1 SprT family zinc-dependent metalloprotease [Enterobacillus tribolii]